MGIKTYYVFIRKNYIAQVIVVPNQSALSDDATFYFFTSALCRPCLKPSDCMAKAIWSSKQSLLQF